MGDLRHEDEYGSITIRKKDLKNLNVRNGNVIAIRWREGIPTDIVDWLSDELGERGFGDCIIVLVEKLSDIKALNEEQMNHYGWVRKDAQ